jgi:hypothetical protein
MPSKNGGRSLRTAISVLPSLPLACQTSALLMSYAPEMKLERVNPDSESGSSRPWHGRILLLNHTRIDGRLQTLVSPAGLSPAT